MLPPAVLRGMSNTVRIGASSLRGQWHQQTSRWPIRRTEYFGETARAPAESSTLIERFVDDQQRGRRSMARAIISTCSMPSESGAPPVASTVFSPSGKLLNLIPHAESLKRLLNVASVRSDRPTRMLSRIASVKHLDAAHKCHARSAARRSRRWRISSPSIAIFQPGRSGSRRWRR